MSAPSRKALPLTRVKAKKRRLYDTHLPLHNPIENSRKALTTKPSLKYWHLPKPIQLVCFASPWLVCQAYRKSVLTMEQMHSVTDQDSHIVRVWPDLLQLLRYPQRAQLH